MDLETFRWLLTEPGQRLLDAAARIGVEQPDPVRAAEALRRVEADPARAAAAATQVRLRERALAKFGPDASRLYFTAEALEQATRTRVAGHRASRLAAYGPASVLDLGCSIGGDLIALQRAGLLAAGVDVDPLRVEIAAANLRTLGLDPAVTVAEATSVDRSPFAVVFADPARRSGRGREFRSTGWSPPWPFVRGLLDRAAVVKAAPGLPHEEIPEGVEAEWVSDEGEVKEVALWSGPLATTARRATVLADAGLATLESADDPYAGDARPVVPLGAYLYEPDGAVIRAGLVTAVADRVGGGLIDEHIAWVTSDERHRTPFARGYRVLERLPYREKPLRAALAERRIGTLAIKSRGVSVTPEALRPRLTLRGEESATLVLTRVAGAGAALLVDPA